MTEGSKSIEAGHEQERQREIWVQKAVEAWNAAEDAQDLYRRTHEVPKGVAREVREEAKREVAARAFGKFDDTWVEKCRESGLHESEGFLDLEYDGDYAILQHEGRSYLFIFRRTIQIAENTANSYKTRPFNIGRRPFSAESRAEFDRINNTGYWKLVKPASIDEHLYNIAKGKSINEGRRPRGSAVFFESGNSAAITKGEIKFHHE